MTPVHPDDVFSDASPAEGLPQPGALPEVTTAAMQGFACLVDKCPDTCCRDWAVPIDRADLDQMKENLSKTTEGRGGLVRLVVLGRPSSHTEAIGSLQMDDRGACPILEADNRCGVHARLGEAALPTTCSVFPRTALAVNGRVEVGGSLGCPEVARLTLLSEQQAQLRPATAKMLPRAYIGKAIATDPTDAYAHHFVEVRQALLDAFGGEHRIGTQLILAGDFAERVQAFFHAGTREFDGAQRAFTARRLRSEIANTRAEALVQALDRDLLALGVPGTTVAALVWTLISGRRRLPHPAKYAALVEAVAASVAAAGAGRSADDPTALWQVYEDRRTALDARVGAHGGLVFRNYCQHHLFRHPYTDSGSLLEALYRLGVNLAAIRLLVALHPDVAELLAAEPDPARDRDVFDRVAVEAIQIFTKAIAHHPEFLAAAVQRGASQSGGFTFGRLVLIAKFV